ncbi:MAG: hypothetical protein K1X42_00625 [Opitutaceae bacterium]|nr:hypothetical protein [Opitutaceae bacterium]
MLAKVLFLQRLTPMGLGLGSTLFLIQWCVSLGSDNFQADPRQLGQFNDAFVTPHTGKLPIPNIKTRPIPG